MTSQNNNSERDAGIDGDDVTLAAGGDVVAQIRAHAAKVRSGEVSAADDVQVWVGDDTVVPPDAAPPAIVAEAGTLLPHDETVAFTRPRVPPGAPATDAAPAAESNTTESSATESNAAERAASLIEGKAPPEVSTSFWTTDQPFRASGIDSSTRRFGAGRGIPLMAWIAVVIVLIVVASVGIAVAVATAGPLT